LALSNLFTGGSIANIASVRPKKNTNAATALVQVLQGKGSLCHLLTKEERDNLARCIQKLLRATYASPDPDGLMGKLRTALDGLMALATVAAESAETTAGMKRPASEIDEDLDGMSVMFDVIVLIRDDTGWLQSNANYLFTD
jgi:hypothetical protein